MCGLESGARARGWKSGASDFGRRSPWLFDFGLEQEVDRHDRTGDREPQEDLDGIRSLSHASHHEAEDRDDRHGDALFGQSTQVHCLPLFMVLSCRSRLSIYIGERIRVL